MDLQSVFDIACKGVLEQACQSVYSYGPYNEVSCAYRGSNGMKCAIGHLLTDEQIIEYNVAEGKAPDTFPRALLNKLVPSQNIVCAIQFLNDLQDAHDSCSSSEGSLFTDQFRYKANLIADKWELKKLPSE